MAEAEGEWRWRAGFAPINREQQPLVIAGYTLDTRNFDAIIFGYYAGGKVLYAGRTRSGFTPASREQLFKRFHAL
jgi:bifunctional non-homologous end joining protein LigD